VKLAQAKGLVAGRRMRVDTTMVETNVHYPTDSSLLGDGVRVLMRIPTIVTTRSDASRPPVPIDRDQNDGAVRCIC
jgi:hypothetical protein